MSWRRKWQPTPVFLPGEFHAWRSLVGYGSWNHKESDTTEPLTLSLFHFQPEEKHILLYFISSFIFLNRVFESHIFWTGLFWTGEYGFLVLKGGAMNFYPLDKRCYHSIIIVIWNHQALLKLLLIPVWWHLSSLLQLPRSSKCPSIVQTFSKAHNPTSYLTAQLDS